MKALDQNGVAKLITLIKSALAEIPKSTTANQQLVTNSDGNIVWEDRLAYETVGEIKYLDEETLAFQNTDGNLKASSLTETLDISAGDTVIVIWDGVRYTCIADDTPGTLMFGNMGIADAGEDTGEPFVFVEESGEWTVGTADSSASHVVSVSGYGVIAKKIDAKYLDMSGISAVHEMPSGQWTYENAKKILDSGKIPYIQMSLDWSALRMYPCQDTTGLTSNEYITFASLVTSENMEIAFSSVAYLKLVKGAGVADGRDVKFYDLPRSDNGTGIIIRSSTGSSKKFKITVDDAGTLSATEITTT